MASETITKKYLKNFVYFIAFIMTAGSTSILNLMIVGMKHLLQL